MTDKTDSVETFMTAEGPNGRRVTVGVKIEWTDNVDDYDVKTIWEDAEQDIFRKLLVKRGILEETTDVSDGSPQPVVVLTDANGQRL